MIKFNLNKQRRSNRSNAASWVLLIILAFVGLIMVIPLIYAVLQSLKPLDELFAFPPKFMVKRPTIENYKVLFELVADMRVPFSRYMFNSVFITVITTVGCVIIASAAAYPLAKYKLKVSWLFELVVLTLLFSGVVLALPQYVILSKLGMINSYWVYIIPNLATPLGLFLMKQFMESVPTALLESARIDGANQYRIFFQIVMPQVKPAWMTLLLFTFQSVWAQQPLNMVFDEQLKLLNMAFTNVIAAGISRVGPSMAAAVVLMLPLILVFLITQSNVIETMSSSGIKE